MKFNCNTQEFSTAVATVVRFIERRANLPVLSSILVTADGGRVVLHATNLECGVEISIPAKVNEKGTVAIPGSILAGFLSNARGKTTSVTLVGEMCKLETERSTASIKTIPHEDFPALPRVSATASFSIKSADFVKLLRSVMYSTSTSTIKPELQSVLVYGEGGKIISAATDSFRLAEKTIALRSGGNVPQLLIPSRNVAELVRILEVVGGETVLYYNENQISTQVGNVYYTSRIIDGAFPNYKQIIPKTFTTEAIVLREDVAQALKSLSIFSDKFSQVSLTFEPSKKSILLSSRNPDVGEQTTTIQATISGEMATMNFNSRYLSDSLQSIVGDSVRLQTNGPGKPLLVRDSSDESFLYLAMPMNR
ncbi:DNA polymerase III subunit beta [Patescibacteria group bacterium]|nr:DNA polymerase III subunit beta [Patescibacteria group bacterium]